MKYSIYQELLLITFSSCDEVIKTLQLVTFGEGGGGGCERVKGDFGGSIHMRTLKISGLEGGDTSEGSMRFL